MLMDVRSPEVDVEDEPLAGLEARTALVSKYGISGSFSVNVAVSGTFCSSAS